MRRTLTITTEPPDARVFLNDQEIGRSPVSRDFLWYGDYEVAVRKDGYQTLQTHWQINPPWYQVFPIDFFSEVCWPGWLHDSRENHFVLETAQTPPTEEVLSRALETRTRSLEPQH